MHILNFRSPRIGMLFALVAAVLAVPTVLSAETNNRITGDAAGPDCNLVAVAVTRMKLSYPIFSGLSGWSRGVPTISQQAADLFLFRPSSGTLTLAVTVKVPHRWANSSRYSMQPRILPDRTVLFMLRGCPKSNDQCNESKFYRLTSTDDYVEIPNWPDFTPHESANLQRCTTYLTYAPKETFVNIGPTGGPWTPVLSFKKGQLVPLNETK